MVLWRARGGWDIEPIVLDRRPCYRVRRHGFLIADCRTPAELEHLLESHGLDYSDLIEDDPACELVR